MTKGYLKDLGALSQVSQFFFFQSSLAKNSKHSSLPSQVFRRSDGERKETVIKSPELLGYGPALAPRPGAAAGQSLCLII